LGKLDSSGHDSGREGGVCVTLGGEFALLFPITAPSGTITKGQQGPMTLTNELAENAGIDDPFTGWLGGWRNVLGVYISYRCSQSPDYGRVLCYSLCKRINTG
jgi:hypothetical protein